MKYLWKIDLRFRGTTYFWSSLLIKGQVTFLAEWRMRFWLAIVVFMVLYSKHNALVAKNEIYELGCSFSPGFQSGAQRFALLFISLVLGVVLGVLLFLLGLANLNWLDTDLSRVSRRVLAWVYAGSLYTLMTPCGALLWAIPFDVNQKVSFEKLDVTGEQAVRSALSKERVNELSSVKGGLGWVKWLITIRSILVGKTTKGDVRLARHISKFLYRLDTANQTRTPERNLKGELVYGSPSVVAYLKACATLLQQSVAGMRHPDTRDLGARVSRTRRGLPRIIPAQQRLLIRKGDAVAIRYWLSVFHLYRVISVPGVLKLDTIPNGSGLPDNVDYSVVPLAVERFFAQLKDMARIIPFGEEGWNRQFPEWSPFITTKANPQVSSPMWAASMKGIILGALAWFHESSSGLQWKHLLVEWMAFAGQGRKTFFDKWSTLVNNFDQSVLKDLPLWLGKLAFLDEPAGKVRVIAMVDIWTQWALAPLAEFLASVLAKIPQDGTFDQVLPLSTLRSAMKRGKLRWIASYDLSAATDCLPLRLQKVLLSHIIGERLAQVWGDILTGRLYKASSFKYGRRPPLRYGVGQPMGALSSWVMLAFTHHFIVQWASFRYYHRFSWFSLYAVLGDDIVIADRGVADEYVKIMGDLGVKIGLAKSVISASGYAEFAKKYWSVRHGLLPMIPIKELMTANHSAATYLELIRKYGCSLASVLTLRGKGYRVKGAITSPYKKQSKWLRGLIIAATHPKGPLAKSWSEWLTSSGLTLQTEARTLVSLKEELIKEICELHAAFRKRQTSSLKSARNETDANTFVEEVLPFTRKASDAYTEPSVALASEADMGRASMHSYVQNTAAQVCILDVYHPQAFRYRRTLNKCMAKLITLLTRLNGLTSASLTLDTLVGVISDLREIRAESFIGRPDPVRQMGSNPIEEREDFRAPVRLYNRYAGAHEKVRLPKVESLISPWEVEFLPPLTYPVDTDFRKNLGVNGFSVDIREVGPFIDPIYVGPSIEEFRARQIKWPVEMSEPLRTSKLLGELIGRSEAEITDEKGHLIIKWSSYILLPERVRLRLKANYGGFKFIYD